MDRYTSGDSKQKIRRAPETNIRFPHEKHQDNGDVFIEVFIGF